MYLLPDGRPDIKSLSERHVPYRDEAASPEAVAKGIAEIEEQYEDELQAEDEAGEEPQ
ncbi:hypothetical protein [Streptomyces sp. NBC_01320]|uniref:hypothetical protein n=1 Tax=Streptomyces sp. NBC_01320 TaxID=2903824 RepID=UPI002E0D1CAD|nr:hypothetical protein OG395_20220 [Streptomyces sp. NBC_01320]